MRGVGFRLAAALFVVELRVLRGQRDAARRQDRGSVAVERGCGRLEWAVLNWNEPAIRFYRALGAVPMNEWQVYRLVDDALAATAR